MFNPLTANSDSRFRISDFNVLIMKHREKLFCVRQSIKPLPIPDNQFKGQAGGRAVGPSGCDGYKIGALRRRCLVAIIFKTIWLSAPTSS